jgi:hypothetical protein
MPTRFGLGFHEEVQPANYADLLTAVDEQP